MTPGVAAALEEARRDPPRLVRWPLVLELLANRGDCPVCAEELVTLARLTCGHTLCTACVSRCTKPTCPFCRAPMASAVPKAEE